MTTIADLSKYDPLEAVDQFEAVILNVEDPGFGDKRDRAVNLGKPWGAYSWVYPGGGADAAQRAFDRAGAAPPLGCWLDYEQDGVTGADLSVALDHGDQLGLKLGVYTYLYIIGSVAGLLGAHPLWLAYYPGANDGTYPEGQDGGARQWGAILWQYTSSNGVRDLSRVLDDAAWEKWTGGGTAAPRKVVDGMWIVAKDDGKPDTYWEPAAGGCLELSPGEAYGRLLAGVPHIEMPILGVIGYGLRLKNLAAGAIPAGNGGSPAPTTVKSTITSVLS